MIEGYLATFNSYIDCLVGLWGKMAQNRAICPKLALGSKAGAYILENSPPGEGGISADVIWGKKI
jgi:hypothetical protein